MSEVRTGTAWGIPTLEIERTPTGFNISGLQYTENEAVYIADYINAMIMAEDVEKNGYNGDKSINE